MNLSPGSSTGRKKTLTSPSGRHLGLYGALVTAHCNSSGGFAEYSDVFDVTTKDMAEKILNMIHGLASVAACHGFYLHRWVRGCIELETPRDSSL
jgi:hypothetical protein